MELFGAVDGARLEPLALSSKAGSGDDAKSLLRIPHLGLTKKSSLDTLKQETVSISSDGDKDKAAPPMSGDESKSTSHMLGRGLTP
jgi:hypothetical protein